MDSSDTVGDFVDARPNSNPASDSEEEHVCTTHEELESDGVSSSKHKDVLDTPTAANAKVYSMKGKKRGKVLIFNHVNFDDSKGNPMRIGSDKDVERVREVFPRLGFQKEDIKVYEDACYCCIRSAVKNLTRDEELKHSDCLVVIILTHGKGGDTLMARDRPYNLYSLIDKFTPTVLKSMAGKPKLFIVQACRGTSHDPGVRLRSSSVQTDGFVKDQVDSLAQVFTYPEYADFLVAMSSHYGHYSFRNQETGSWLVHELCNVIEECDKEARLETTSIIDILTETNLAVSMRSSAGKGVDKQKQVSSFYSTLTRKLYFGSTK